MDLGLRCSLFPLLLSVLVLSASGARRCAPQVLPDMVIDIGLAVAQGARFTDPLKVANVEDCLAACCRQLNAEGDRSCNLLVYDARTPGLQSCYLFHCPTLDSCPLSASPGVLSYSFWSDPSRPGKHDPDEEQPKTSGSGEKQSGPPVVIRKPSSAIASQVSAEHDVKEELADSSKSIASRLLHLADEMDQHLEKMESGGERRVPASPPAAAPSSPPAAAPASPPAAAPASPPASPPAAAPASPPASPPAAAPASPPASPPAAAPALQTALAPGHREVMKLPFNAKAAKPGKAKLLPTHRPTEAATTAPKRATARRSTAAPRPVPRTSHVVPPAATHRVSGTKEVPGSTVRSPTEVPALTTAHHTRPPHLATRPAPSWTSPRKGTKLSTKNNDRAAAGDEGKTPARLPPESYSPAREDPAVILEEAPRKVGGAGSAGVLPPPGDKSGLVAALIFGLLFLMAVIGLVSRKVSEARRRHRYTKLDYLINGMYVDT